MAVSQMGRNVSIVSKFMVRAATLVMLPNAFNVIQVTSIITRSALNVV